MATALRIYVLAYFRICISCASQDGHKQTSLIAFLLPSKVQKLSSEPQLLSVQKVHDTQDLVVQPDINDFINLSSPITDNQRLASA